MGYSMSIKIYIHPYLFGFTNDIESAQVDGNTVGECFEQLVKQFPGLEKGLFDKQSGKILPVFDIWVNDRSSYPEELAKPVKDGDELYITTVMADG